MSSRLMSVMLKKKQQKNKIKTNIDDEVLYLFMIQYPHDSTVARTVRQETVMMVLKSKCPVGRTWLKIHKMELECDAYAPAIQLYFQ